MNASARCSTRWLRLIAVLMGLAMIAAACGGDDGGSDSADEPDGNGAPAPEGDPVAGGEAIFALEAETSGGYCLQEAQLATAGIQVARAIYDTLTIPDADGELQPHLAESFEPNDDFTEWTITLRPDITFHDGSALDATVVKNNIDAYRGAYEGRSPLLFVFVFERIASVEVVDPLTVKVAMSAPWSAFDWAMWGSFRVGIAGQAQLDDVDNCGRNLVGTGPFQLESASDWVTDEQMTLQKNAGYWRSDEDGTALPYLDTLVFQPIPESAQRSNALDADQIDILQTASTEQIADRLQPLADEGSIDLFFNDSFSAVNYGMFNVREGSPFANKNARLAYVWALDERLLDDLRGAGLGTVANGPFNEGVIGYLADTGFPGTDGDEAKKFAQAYEDETGEPLEFTYTTTSVEASQLTAQEIQTQMAEAGIKMSIDASSDQSTLINKALAADFDVIGWRNHPGADPDTQYNWWKSGSPVNFGGFSDPEIDRLLDEGRAAAPGPERDALYEDLNRQFASEVWNAWTTFSIWGIASQPEVNGLMGPALLDGSEPFTGLEVGIPVEGIWVSA